MHVDDLVLSGVTHGVFSSKSIKESTRFFNELIFHSTEVIHFVYSHVVSGDRRKRNVDNTTRFKKYENLFIEFNTFKIQLWHLRAQVGSVTIDNDANTSDKMWTRIIVQQIFFYFSVHLSWWLEISRYSRRLTSADKGLAVEKSDEGLRDIFFQLCAHIQN